MDRRQQKTRDAIFDAFSTLLSSKSYTRITIQEIIDEANIGRSTFYSHFETKDELLKSLRTDTFDKMHSNNPTLSSGNPHSMILDVLYHIKENEKIIKGVFLSESGELFMNYFKNYFSNHIEQHLFASYNERIMDIPKDFLINHISGSFLEMVKWWVSRNMKQTPEELTSYFISVISPVIMKMYTKK